jgi:hypothetical protein
MEDGGYLCDATLEEGAEAEFSFLMDPALEYEFCWSLGEFAEECAFTISIQGEEVCSAAFGDCAAFFHGQVLYPVCEHNYEITDVTAPTCTDFGYIGYTCTLCGDSYLYADADPLGHTRSSEAVVVPPSCQINGYTYCGCTVCGETLYYDLLPMMPHALGEDGCCTLCGEPYYVQLMVGEVYVTYENYQDILGDGTASYDPATNTLTLKNFYYDGELPGVYSQIPLDIVLEGDNYIGVSSPYNSGFCFDSVGGDFTISGTGSLTVVSAGYAIYTENYGDTTLTLGGDISITAFAENTAAIYLYSKNTDLVIGDNVRLTLGTGENPICADAVYMNGETSGSATITDNACVNICTNNGDGIYVGSIASSLTISGDATVYASGEDCGLSAENITITGGAVTILCGSNDIGIYAGNLTVTGGTVTAIGGFESIGIDVWGKCVITGGTVHAESEFEGLNVGNLSVSGGKVTVSSFAYGITTRNGCAITGGMVEVLNGGLCADMVDDYGNAIEGDAVVLGDNMQIVDPEDVFIGEWFDGYATFVTVQDEYGNYMPSFVIACAHQWEDGVCSACGEPLSVKAEGFSLSFENEILVNLYYTSAAAQSAEEHGMLVFYEKPENPTFDTADLTYYAEYTGTTEFCMSQTAGIPAKEMGDERYYVAYVKLADGSYIYSDVCAYSPAAYAYNKLAAENTDPELKALCVAMLNYGAAAQEFFGYRTDDLMNAKLTAEQQALASGFHWDLFTGIVPFDKETTFVKTEGFASKSASVSFDGSFGINYYITPSVDVDNMTFHYWFNTYHYVDNEVILVPTLGHADMDKLENGTFWIQYNNVAAKEIDDTIYVAVTYEVDGVTYCTGVIPYSISTYCRNNAEGAMGDLAYATAVYGYYASQYFAN